MLAFSDILVLQKYSAKLFGLQHVSAGPGSSFVIPALRPYPTQPESYKYSWSFCSDSLGLTLDEATGKLTVPSSPPPSKLNSLNYLCVKNSVQGSMSSSSTLFLLAYYATQAPAFAVQSLYPKSDSSLPDVLGNYTFYTGFPIFLNLSVQVGGGDFTGFLQDWSNPSPFQMDYDGKTLNLTWMKPCLGQHNEFTHCYSFYRGVEVSRPFCVHITLLEDSAPVFLVTRLSS